MKVQNTLQVILLLLVFPFVSFAQSVSGPLGEHFGMRMVAGGLSDPWEITYGPDKQLWVTDSKGYLVSRIDPASGKKTVLLDLNSERHFSRYDKMGKASGGKP
jgi:hypothetical protein